MIVVTGMHRSGTSAICSFLAGLGLDFGPHGEFLPKDRWNARGYYENRQIFSLNNEIVTGSRGSSAPWFKPFEKRNLLDKLSMARAKARYLLMPSTATLERRARSRASDLARLGEIFAHRAVKDPRFCLLLESWERHVPVERVLFCYRHPTQVAASLRKRESLPNWWGYRFWLYHVEALLRQTEALDVPVSVVDFPSLFGQEEHRREARILFSFCGVEFSEPHLEEVFTQRLDKSLHHHRHDRASLPARVQRAVDKVDALRRAQVA